MKLNFKLTIGLFAMVMLVYTACKKSGSDATTQTVSPNVVSGLVAVNFTKSLAGSYGGININDGIKAPKSVESVQSTKGLSTNAFTSICDFKIDTPYVIKSNQGDSVKSTAHGRVRFNFVCTSGQPTGFVVYDSLINKGTAPIDSFRYAFEEVLGVYALNAQKTLIAAGGEIKSFGDFYFKNPSYKPIYEYDVFNLLDIRVNLSNNADITSGTVKFVSDGSNYYGKWHYTGTVTFLGNHKADVVINGKTYHVDLLTGKVS